MKGVTLAVRQTPSANSTPAILTRSTRKINENVALSLPLNADRAVTWSIAGGLDANLFSISANTLSLTARNYEDPEDSDQDNIYKVNIKAVDKWSNQANSEFTIKILNVIDFAIPINTVAPSISGDVFTGNTLVLTSVGTWGGEPLPTYSYQWQRSNTDISGANSTSYVLTANDVGSLISCIVIGTNSTGSVNAISNFIGPIVDPDTIPDAFTFTDKIDAQLSTSYESNAITVNGINNDAAISVTGGEYQINSESWTSTSGTVSLGDIVKVRGTSSSEYATVVNVVLTIGTVSDTFSITTKSQAFADSTDISIDSTEYTLDEDN